MASGCYDGPHPTASYGHGDSWRPAEPSPAWLNRPAYYDRRPPSPGRHYTPYDGYYSQEDSYRTNSYRPEDDDPYYSRSPSPDRYSRYSRPVDTWERPDPWANVPAPWDDPLVSVSPTSSTSKVRRDPMLATRMFEPSDSWKQTHVDRPHTDSVRSSTARHAGDYLLQSRTPNSNYPIVFSAHASGDSYKPMAPYRDAYARSDSYRPGPGWIDRSRRPSNTSSPEKAESSSRFNDHHRRISGAGSILSSSSRPSSHRQGHDRHSRSRSPRSSTRSYSRSRSRGRRSISRDRSRSDRSLSRGRLVHKLPTSAGGSSLSSPKKDTSAVKYSWSRPTSIPGNASGVKPSTKLPSTAQSLQKSSWTRSTSRSSIASSRASDTAPSQLLKASPGDSSPVANDIVVICPITGIVPTPGVTKSDDVPERDVRTACDQSSSAHSPSVAGEVLLPALPAQIPQVAQPSVSSPLLPSGSPVIRTQTNVNSAVKSAAAITNNQSTIIMSEYPTSTPSDPISKEKDTAALRKRAIFDERPAIVEPRRSVASLPTPLPTPKPTPTSEHPPTPPLLESIPTKAKSLQDALRIVVMTRLLCDRQTREERVDPVLSTNQARAALSHRDGPTGTEEVIKEVLQGPRHDRMMEKFAMIKGSLVERFEERQHSLTKKVQRLKQEYLSLHERWLAHCAVLDEQNKPSAPEPEIIQPAGRTTRRSMANLGDTVRSDLEMEQIIASLGNDDATDPNHLSLRNLATIPDMLSVTRGKIDYTFDDTNHLVENPSEYYGPRTGIHDWTDQEKEIFLDKFAAHPKQFGMIAAHLPNKTAAQCVDYYYLHKKKIIDFRKVVSQYAPNKRKRGRTGKKKGNGLLADIRQHDAEVHGETGSPRSSGRPVRGRKPMPPPEIKEPKKGPPSRRRTQLDLTPSAGSATPTPEPETRRRGGRRSVPAPLSRTVSVSIEDAEEETTEDVSERPTKRSKRSGRKVIKSAATVVDEPSTPEAKTVELADSISRRKSGGSLAQWSDEDKSLFLTLLAQHGDDFKRIAASMPNKTTIQVSNYYRANNDELDLAKVAAGAPKRSPTPDASYEAQGVPTPSTIVTPATEVTEDPMASLAPDSLPSNGASTSRLESLVHTSDPKTLATWPSSAPRQLTPPLPTSHVRGYYPANGRPTYYPHPIPQAYPPVPYTYPPYAAPHYSAYPDPYALSPYAIPDPNHRMHMTRENSYPVVPPSHPSYHYSLESS